MVRLVVNVIGIKPRTKEEIITLAKIESDRFDPDHLDAQVGVAIDNACGPMGSDLRALRVWQPEVSVVLTADDEASLHLTVETLQRLVEAGASFDFDPYV
jgi:hypothetical protein